MSSPVLENVSHNSRESSPESHRRVIARFRAELMIRLDFREKSRISEASGTIFFPWGTPIGRDEGFLWGWGWVGGWGGS